jgi:hypothetical protein
MGWHEPEIDEFLSEHFGDVPPQPVTPPPDALREALDRLKAGTLGGPLVEGMKPLVERDLAEDVIRAALRAQGVVQSEEGDTTR